MSPMDDRPSLAGGAAPACPEGRFWRFDLRQASDTGGTEPRLETLRVAAKTRFGVDDWIDETEVNGALTDLLTGFLGEPVTVGDHTTVDGTEYGYLLRVFFQTKPLRWGGRFGRRDLHRRGRPSRDDAAGRGGSLSADGRGRGELLDASVAACFGLALRFSWPSRCRPPRASLPSFFGNVPPAAVSSPGLTKPRNVPARPRKPAPWPPRGCVGRKCRWGTAIPSPSPLGSKPTKPK